MAGFAYYIPRSEAERIALSNLMALASEASHYAKTIGLQIDGQDGELLFQRLAESLSNHKEKEFYDDGSDQ